MLSNLRDENNGQLRGPITGTPIYLLNMPAGCPFAPRCDNAMKICLTKRCEQMRINDEHIAACWMNVKAGLEDGSLELDDPGLPAEAAEKGGEA